MIDAAILSYRTVPPREDLHIELLPKMRSGFVCRGGHPLVSHGPNKITFADMRSYPLISSIVSDDVARALVARYGPEANPERWLHISCDEIAALIEAVRNSDAIFLGVVATTQAGIDRGEFVKLVLSPEADLGVQLALITLQGRTEAPALDVVRRFCMNLSAADATSPQSDDTSPQSDATRPQRRWEGLRPGWQREG
jgi:DNA-binding transcriptional LysR family regulator